MEPHRLVPAVLTAAAVAVTIAACDGGDAPPTYRGAVQPLLARRCTSCHTDGAIAPFPLDTYDAARGRSAQIAAATRTRVMPPFPVDNGGSCNHYQDARWLTDDEIALLDAWDRAGAPEGDARIALAPGAKLPKLEGDLRTVTMPVTYVPDATKADDYRCFVVDAPDTAPTYYVTGFDVTPGEPRIVHHVIVFAPKDDAAVDQARALDAADATPGYSCFGAAGVPAGAVAAWAPGGGATTYPAATGVKLTGGRPLVLQVHYNTLGGPGLGDRTGVVLSVAHDGVSQGRFLPLADLDLNLPPRSTNVVEEATIDVAATGKLTIPVKVRGVYPHMHTLGQTLEATIVHGDGSETCITRVPRWDFHWQMLYFFDEPLTLSPTDKLRVRCTYDTRTRSETTTFGEGTSDEMCIAALYVSL